MSYLFIALVAGAIFHFVWDGILAPSLRMGLRHELFAERDKLREFKALHPDLDGEIFAAAHRSINTSIRLVSLIQISTFVEARRRYLGDETIREVIRNQKAVVANCQVSEIKSIWDQAGKVVANAFLVNAGGWFVYLVPVFFAAGCLLYLRDAVIGLLLLPSRVLDQILPPSRDVMWPA